MSDRPSFSASAPLPLSSSAMKTLVGICAILATQSLFELSLYGRQTVFTFFVDYTALAVLTTFVLARYNRSYATLFVIALAARLIFFWGSRYFFFSLGLEDGSPGQSDPVTYAELGWEYLNFWETGKTESPIVRYGRFTTRIYYFYNAAFFMLLGGKYFFAPVMGNIFIGGLTAPVCAAAARRLTSSSKVALMVGILAAVDPKMIAFSAMNLKMAIIVFLVGLAILTASVAWSGSRKAAALIVFMAAIAVLSLFRGSLAVILVLGLAGGLVDHQASRMGIKAPWRVLFWAGAAVTVIYTSNPISAKLLAYAASFTRNIDLGQYKLGQSFFAVMGDKSMVEAPYLLPLALFAAVIGAFPPWRLDGTWLSYVVRPGVMWLHLLVPFIAFGLYRVMKGEVRIRLAGGLFLFAAGYLYAVLVSTRGTPEALRYIAALNFVIYLLAAIGLEKASSRAVKGVIAAYPVVVFGLAIAYYGLKSYLRS